MCAPFDKFLLKKNNQYLKKYSHLENIIMLWNLDNIDGNN